MAHNIDKASIAMKKARSSMDKVMKMLEDDKYCIDVIQQNLAIIGLLRSVNTTLLEGHVQHCVKNAAMEKDSKRLDKMMEELLLVINIAQKK